MRNAKKLIMLLITAILIFSFSTATFAAYSAEVVNTYQTHYTKWVYAAGDGSDDIFYTGKNNYTYKTISYRNGYSGGPNYIIGDTGWIYTGTQNGIKCYDRTYTFQVRYKTW